MSVLKGLTRFGGARFEVIEGRCWADPSLDRLLDEIPRLPPPARLDRALNHLRPLRTEVERHHQATTQLGDHLLPCVELMRAWIADPRTYPDDRVDLLALLGRTLIDHAWQVRGSGAASTVDKKAWPTFHEILTEADEVLLAATQMVPEHPAAAAFRMLTALGLGVPSDEWWTRFEAARLARPTLYTAHKSMLTAMCAKWYGSDEAMFGFAHQVAEQAPPGDPVVAMLPLAHAEYICGVQMGRSDPQGPSPEEARLADEDAVMAASMKWCADGSRPVPPHAYDLDAHNYFGWFLGTSRRYQERGRWHLAQTGHRINASPWYWLAEDGHQAYADLHRQLGLS